MLYYLKQTSLIALDYDISHTNDFTVITDQKATDQKARTVVEGVLGSKKREGRQNKEPLMCDRDSSITRRRF